VELVVFVLLLVVLDVVAARWGVDSRQLDDAQRQGRATWFGGPRDTRDR
jgi:nitrogen fixation-related uncharacterized protein